MKRRFTQTATRTITLTREIVVEFPAEVHPDSVDDKAVESLLAGADVPWEAEGEDFDIDGVEWHDADDADDADVVYEE